MSLLDKNGGKADDKGGGNGNPGAAGDGGNPADKSAGGGAARPDYIPEKFWKDGKADLEGLGKSYVELEGWKGKKVEELTAEALKADRANRKVPEKADGYALPALDQAGLKPEALKDDPLVGLWREVAHKHGIGQDGFEEGLKRFVELQIASAPDLETEKKALGENANARIEAIQAWAKENFSQEEYQQLRTIANSAAGIKTLEKLQKMAFGSEQPGNGEGGKDDPAKGGDKITADQLKAWQNDPRYWDHTQRDPTFVKMVDDGYQKLYGKK